MRRVTEIVFLDIEAVSDMVWYDGLVLKAVRLGINRTIIRVKNLFEWQNILG